MAKAVKTSMLKSIQVGDLRWLDLKGGKIEEITEIEPKKYEIKLKIGRKVYYWWITANF
jgi:hypothetical protein